jgi:hypothetical protein
MDKTLFKAYVRELVKETVEDEVRKVLPKVLAEAVREVKTLQESTPTTRPQRPPLDRSKLAELMGMERIGDTLVTSTKNMGQVMAPPPGLSADDPTVQAINKDYSQLMKKMGLSK